MPTRPLQVIGVVSDFPMLNKASDETVRLTPVDMQKLADRLVGERATYEHTHPKHSKPERPIDQHLTVGTFTDAWVNELGCVGARVVIDDAAAEYMRNLLDQGEVTGFSLGLDLALVRDVASGELSFAKGFVECSLVKNPEFHATCYASGDDIDPALAQKLRQQAASTRAKRELAAVAMQASADVFELGARNEQWQFSAVAASSRELSADELAHRERKVEQLKQATADFSKRSTLTNGATQATKQTHQQSMSDDAKDEAIRDGRVRTQRQPANDGGPFTININTAPQAPLPSIDRAGGVAQRRQQLGQFNGARLPGRQAPLQQQQPVAAANDDDDGDVVDEMQDYGDDQLAGFESKTGPAALPMNAQKPRRQVYRGDELLDEPKQRTPNPRRAKQEGLMHEYETLRRVGDLPPLVKTFDDFVELKQHQLDKAKRVAQMQTKRTAAGKSSAAAADDADDQEDVAELHQPKKTAAAAAGAFTITPDDDEETVKAKLLLARRSAGVKPVAAAPAAAAKKSALSAKSIGAFSMEDNDDEVSAAAAAAEKPSQFDQKVSKAMKQIESIKMRIDAGDDDDDGDDEVEAAQPKKKKQQSQIDDVGGGDDVRAEAKRLRQQSQKLAAMLKTSDGDSTTADEFDKMQKSLTKIGASRLQIKNTIANLRAQGKDEEAAELAPEDAVLDANFHKLTKMFSDKVKGFIEQAIESSIPVDQGVKSSVDKLTEKAVHTLKDVRSLGNSVKEVISMVTSASSALNMSTFGRIHDQLELQADMVRQKEAAERKRAIDDASRWFVNQADPKQKQAMRGGAQQQQQQQQQQQGLTAAEILEQRYPGIGADSILTNLQMHGDGAPVVNGVNVRTQRRNIPFAEMTPNDLFGLPFNCIPANAASSINDRAGAKGCEKAFRQQRPDKESLPEDFRNGKVDGILLHGMHMTQGPLFDGLRTINSGSKKSAVRGAFDGQLFTQHGKKAKPPRAIENEEDPKFYLLDREQNKFAAQHQLVM